MNWDGVARAGLGAHGAVFALGVVDDGHVVDDVDGVELTGALAHCLLYTSGYPGCAGCAEAILAGKAPVTACAPAGAEGAAKIAEIMGMEAPSGEKQVAHVLCNGGEASVKNFEYVGLHDCVAATKVAGGPTACSFGCMRCV